MAKRLVLSKRQLFALIGYEPHPLQWEIHESRARRRTVACAVRFGKTTIGVYECVAAILEPREQAFGWIVGPTLDTSERMFTAVLDLLTRHFKPRVLATDLRAKRVVVLNLGGGKSELRAKTADSPSALLGASLDFVVVDEAAAIRRDTWEQYLAPRLVDRNGWSLLLSVPKAGGGWFYDAFRMGQRNRDPDARSWSAPTSANPHISPAVIEAERSRVSDAVFREQFLGQFVAVEGERCFTCGCPSPDVSGVVVIHGGEVLGRCEECGQLVDTAGQTLVARLSERFNTITVIELHPRVHAPPPIPVDDPLASAPVVHEMVIAGVEDPTVPEAGGSL